MRLAAPRRIRTAIRLTPLIDVVFLLLVFFILAGRFDEISLRPLDLASAGLAAPDAPPRETVLLRLDADGGARLNGEALPEGVIDARLQALRGRFAGLQVVLDPEPGLDLQALIDWLDRLEGLGLDRVRLLPAQA